MNITEINQRNLSLLDVNQLKAFLDIFKGVSNPKAKLVIKHLTLELGTRKTEAVEEASIGDIIKAVKAATKKIGGIIDKVFDDKGFQDAYAKYVDNPKDKNRLKKIQDYTNGMLGDMTEETDLEEASASDIKKVLAAAEKAGGELYGNTIDFGQGAVTTVSVEKGKIKFDGGKSSGVEYFNNVKDAIMAFESVDLEEVSVKLKKSMIPKMSDDDLKNLYSRTLTVKTQISIVSRQLISKELKKRGYKQNHASMKWESVNLEESISVKALTTAAAIRLKKKLDNKWSSYDFNIDKTGLRLSVPNEKGVISYIKKQPEVDTLEEAITPFVEAATAKIISIPKGAKMQVARHKKREGYWEPQNTKTQIVQRGGNYKVVDVEGRYNSGDFYIFAANNKHYMIPAKAVTVVEDVDLEEAINWWTVTITKKAGKLFKGQTVDVKASNSAQAIKKGIKQMKGDPALVPGGSVDAVLGESRDMDFEKTNVLTYDEYDEVKNFKNFNKKDWKRNSIQKKYVRIKKIKESTDLEEGKFYKPKINRESETITFINDAEAKQAEKLFTSLKLKVKRSAKRISFINTAEFKAAKSKVMESTDLEEAIRVKTHRGMFSMKKGEQSLRNWVDGIVIMSDAVKKNQRKTVAQNIVKAIESGKIKNADLTQDLGALIGIKSPGGMEAPNNVVKAKLKDLGLNESKKDIESLEKMIKNPDPKRVKSYGGTKYVDMLKSKLAKLQESTDLEEAAKPFKELEKAWIRTKGNDEKREKLVKKFKLKPLISNVRQGSIKLGPMNDLKMKDGNHTMAGLDAEGELIFISNNPVRIHYPSNTKKRPDGVEIKENTMAHQRLVRVVEVALGERPEDTNEFIKEANIDLTMTPSSIQKSYKKFMIEMKAKAQYEIYHKTYTDALQSAKSFAIGSGYEVDDDDWFNQISTGPKKPGKDKMNRFSILLTKNGKEQKKRLQIQITNIGTSNRTFELNAYIS